MVVLTTAVCTVQSKGRSELCTPDNFHPSLICINKRLWVKIRRFYLTANLNRWTTIIAIMTSIIFDRSLFHFDRTRSWSHLLRRKSIEAKTGSMRLDRAQIVCDGTSH
ncbi:hypothetical protein EMCRGX_G022126 [Ephydatia muelleri]